MLAAPLVTVHLLSALIDDKLLPEIYESAAQVNLHTGCARDVLKSLNTISKCHCQLLTWATGSARWLLTHTSNHPQ